ncbi:urea ABC transporter substrate-binding protein [Lyngbya aestuarii]|uniref:urea ABC transporter substrate-binding protein n=1 Tax=Lyngbya aestuarii TaxID=118322 RepID=UPI00403D9B9A
MSRRWHRRKFLSYSCVTCGSILLRACTNSPPRTTLENTTVSGSLATSTNSTSDVKVGILHSLSGTMAISEKSVVKAVQLAIEEINAAGGVLGKQIVTVTEDGASEWPTFAEKAIKLIEDDQVSVVFGCWTSASRKAVKPIFEEREHMLWYPIQYEGQECSKNIFYTGATPNQQLEPAVDWLLDNKGKEFFLVGSDYVFPRTANSIIKAQLENRGGKAVGEEYLPLGNQEISSLLTKIRTTLPSGGVIFNTLNGDSNVAFFQELQSAGFEPEQHPVMSLSIGEAEVQAIGSKYLKGHYAAGNYFQTLDTPANHKFVKAVKEKYGENSVTNDSMEAAYIAVYLWKQAVEKAGTVDDLEKVRKAAYGQTFEAPEGKITMESNNHISKFVRIGEVQEDGLVKIVYSSDQAVMPVPWSQFIVNDKKITCDWSEPDQDANLPNS